MGRITDANDLLSLLTGGAMTLDILTQLITDGGAVPCEPIFIHKDSRVQGAAAVTPIAGSMYSLFGNDGTPLPGAAAPGAFRNPTNTSAGMLMQANPTGGRKKYPYLAAATSTVAGQLMIYDRLADMSGMDGTLLTAQNVNGGASGDVTRYTNGVGNQLWIEIYTAIGVTQRTLTAAYKDGANAAQTSPLMSIGGAALDEAGRIIPVPLVGSTVKGCTSITLNASTGTAGNFGITIAHPLIYLPIAGQSAGVVRNFLNAGVPEILTNAALGMAWIPSVATASSIDVFLQFVEV